MKSAASTLDIEQQLREMNEALLISSVHQHELTEQAQNAEAALRDSEQRFRTLFELGPVAVYSCDASGVIQDSTAAPPSCGAAHRRIGDTDERFCGSFRMIRPDGSVLAHEQCPMAEVLCGKIPHVRDAEVRIDRPDGSRITVVVNIRPLKNEQGEITGAINCFYDITERKEIEQRLRESEQRFRQVADEAEAANRAKDMFLATLSHEIRTPLSAIVGWMQILQGGTEGGCSEAELNEGLEVIERNARTMVQLLDDVMDVSRIISGQGALEIRPCELNAVIRAGIDVVRSAARAKDIALSAELDPAASVVSCDAARMQQVVWNLLSNAIKFTPKGGKVACHACARGKRRAHSGQRQRTGNRPGAVALRLRPLPPGRQQHAPTIWRTGAGAIHRETSGRTARRDGAGEK